jgi:RimJ/RimL family protein N-acetyltransferase
MQVTYRKATPNDLQLLFDWANEPEVRNNSFNSQPIPLEEHTKWFLSKVNDTNTLFYIAEMEKQPVGMVRFDIKEENTIISILIDKNHRGKGLASILLVDCCKLYFEQESKPIHAYIKNSNTASIHSFEKANFSFLKEEKVYHVESKIYSKEKENDK